MSPSEQDFTDLATEGQMAVFWRILHLTTVAWGNFPAGQLLVALTMAFMHNRGMNPTLSDLCAATGLPKATVSRYVSWQLQQGLAKETIDPEDRRRRVLMRTKEGQRAWDWQIDQVQHLFDDISTQSKTAHSRGFGFDSAELLAVMKDITAEVKNLELP